MNPNLRISPNESVPSSHARAGCSERRMSHRSRRSVRTPSPTRRRVWFIVFFFLNMWVTCNPDHVIFSALFIMEMGRKESGHRKYLEHMLVRQRAEID